MYNVQLLCKNGIAIYEKSYESLENFTIMKFLTEFDEKSGFKRKDIDIEKSIRNINKTFKMNIKSILTVEDDDTMRAILFRYGDKTGNYIEAVADAEQAEKIVKKHNHLFNVVLLDKNLPGQDGLSFGLKLKSFAPQIKVFIITGDAESVDIEYALSHGIERVIEKPITLDAFKNATMSHSVIKKVA